MSPARDQQRFTIVEVTDDWQPTSNHEKNVDLTLSAFI